MAEQLYARLELLNSERHKNLRVKPLQKFEKFKNLNSCVILVTEFFEAAKYYPLVFSLSPRNEYLPVAILGADNNAFVQEDGLWREGVYIPAFVRRYPFIFVEDIEKGEKEKRFFLAIDREAENLSENEGERLFDEEGKETQFLQGIKQFLLNYDRDFQITKQFVDELEKLELFRNIEATVKSKDGKIVVIKNLLAVDEDKFHRLSDEKVVDLFRKGYLGAVQAHLMSLTNFSRIIK